MAEFTGTLRANEIYSSIRNMIISQQVFADNIKGTYGSLAEKSRVDGTLYGDTKLYYATDALSSYEWMNDAEAANLLQLHRPKDPSCQAVVIDKFRQIAVTTDKYLTKRAWGTEGIFNEFNSVMLAWIGDTKKIFDSTLVNVFYGTEETNVGKQERTITLPTATGEEGNRLTAQTIAEDLANLLDELKDVSRDYNDYGYIRSYEASDFMIIWNNKVYNKILKVDLPTIFHNEGLTGEFEKVVLPARYFGKELPAGTTSSGANNTTIRARIEGDFGPSGNKVHLFAGDLLPANTPLTGIENTVYVEDDTILFKVVHKRAIPFLSAFSTQTVFVNPRSLTDTHYLTFGYGIDRLSALPYITVRKTVAAGK